MWLESDSQPGNSSNACWISFRTCCGIAVNDQPSTPCFAEELNAIIGDYDDICFKWGLAVIQSGLAGTSVPKYGMSRIILSRKQLLLDSQIEEWTIPWSAFEKKTTPIFCCSINNPSWKPVIVSPSRSVVSLNSSPLKMENPFAAAEPPTESPSSCLVDPASSVGVQNGWISGVFGLLFREDIAMPLELGRTWVMSHYRLRIFSISPCSCGSPVPTCWLMTIGCSLIWTPYLGDNQL